MQREEDQQLWDLMGSASRPSVSPFFARNVLRRVREQGRWGQAFQRWLGWRRLLPASGLVAATAAIFVAYALSFHPSPAGDDDVVAKIDAQDYEVVADLDNLLASDENNLWDDNSTL
jgi:hypothetical protein